MARMTKQFLSPKQRLRTFETENVSCTLSRSGEGEIAGMLSFDSLEDDHRVQWVFLSQDDIQSLAVSCLRALDDKALGAALRRALTVGG